jgi:hypothetical protein
MRRMALVVVVILAAGCDSRKETGAPTIPVVVPTAPVPPSTGVLVSGQVIDFVTGAGIQGSVVAFGDITAVTGVTGRYALRVAAPGRYEPQVDGARMGTSRVTGSDYRGDFLVRPGVCVSRYGTVADARTLRPVAGATVSLIGGPAVTAEDGWYRLDVACPAGGTFGFNTTFISVSHPNYVAHSEVVGRGVSGATRLDFELQAR